MTFKDNFVAEVKCNGRILRVIDGIVYLPFGSEYSILLKNLDSRKASIRVHIDGGDVLNGQSLLLEPNTETELTGELRGNAVRNRFKFIEKTEQISNHRGDRIDDGMIRIEFAYEKPTPKIRQIINEYHHYYHHHHNYDYWPKPSPYRWTTDSVVYGSVSETQNISNNAGNQTLGSADAPENISQTFNQMSVQTPINDMGITVKGSETYQQFQYGSIGDLEDSQVITIQLRGQTAKSTPVQQPLTVKAKVTCPTCGTRSKSNTKYCPNCGTYLL